MKGNNCAPMVDPAAVKWTREKSEVKKNIYIYNRKKHTPYNYIVSAYIFLEYRTLKTLIENHCSDVIC